MEHIERGDRVISMMFRSICCCQRNSKVADSSVETRERKSIKKVLIVCTTKVMARGLLGRLVEVLENRNLRPAHMQFLLPTQEMIDKSSLMKPERQRNLENERWMALVFSGKEAQTGLSDCIIRFKTEYDLQREDVYWTETDEQAAREQEIFLKNDETAGTSNGEVARESEHNGPEQPRAVESKVEEVDEGKESELNSVVSSEGPHASVESSRIHSPEPKGGHEPTAEVISNTAIILQPVGQPSPLPTIQQPTKIE